MMHEALFHFIWKFSLYYPTNLETTAGEPVTVLYPGLHNMDSGPDFSEARIRIGATLLVGNVELHLKSSDWQAHGHDQDDAYSKIILHVVFQDDEPENLRHPKLVLGPQIRPEVFERFERFMTNNLPIPCAPQWHVVTDITKESWLHRVLAERWEQKLSEWREQWQQAGNDWRTLLYWRLAHNFGFKTNATPFLLLAQSVPLNVIARHKHNLLQIEALLFGQAGLLSQSFDHAYPQQLQREYLFLRGKYQLTPLEPHLWKFMRMRPANFPTVRIAQFAALLHQSAHLFADFLAVSNAEQVLRLLTVTASDYWREHYTFDGAASKATDKSLGASAIENIILNTIAPLQFFYGQEQGGQSIKDAAVQLLAAVKPEKNQVIEAFGNMGWRPQNGLQSQAMIQLFRQYCSERKCLQCAIGLSILKSRPDK